MNWEGHTVTNGRRRGGEEEIMAAMNRTNSFWHLNQGFLVAKCQAVHGQLMDILVRGEDICSAFCGALPMPLRLFRKYFKRRSDFISEVVRDIKVKLPSMSCRHAMHRKRIFLVLLQARMSK